MEDSREHHICKDIDELIETYGDTVYRVAFQNMGNIADAQDISQDVFIKIFKKRPIFESKEHEKAWILRVTMNLCKDYWKHQSLFKRTELKEQIYQEEMKEYGLLYEVLKLPMKYRNVIYLFYYEEYSVSMIAKILHKKEATILTWLHRARKQLKVNLEEGDENE